VAIVGVGLIGGSIGLALRRSGPRLRVVGIDRPAVLRRARARGAVHAGTASLARGLAGADLVVLALPVDAIIALLPRVRRLVDPGALVTDVGSTKEAILRAARRAGLGSRFVGGHPIAGSERSGVEHADAARFRGAPWILCPATRDGPSGAPGRESAASPVARVSAFVRRLGAHPVPLDARLHDRVMARLSHLPQLASVALVNAAARGGAERCLRLAGPAFLQFSRLADSSPVLWAGILGTNRRAVDAALADFVGELRRLRRSLGGGAARHFRRAARIRARVVARPGPGTAR
jgi:prephenate dehydrogenase